MIGRLFKKTKKFKNEYAETRDFLEEFRKENEQKWLIIEEHYRQDCKRADQELLARDKQLEANEKMVAEMVDNTNKIIEASKKLIEESAKKVAPIRDLKERMEDSIKENIAFNCNDRDFVEWGTGCKRGNQNEQ